jgi:RNA polymerase sigma-70 factor (ECF subfamily)
VTDERLLERAASGDEAAFQVLYERYRDPIFRFAYRLLGSSEAAEDVTHDCFVSLIRRPRNFDPKRGSLRTYIYAAARNLALKLNTRARREAAIEEVVERPGILDLQGPMALVLDRELRAAIEEAVAALPPLQREALVLFEYEELPLSEISVIVGADVGAVKARLHRAREQLRRSLAPYFRIGREAVRVKRA